MELKDFIKWVILDIEWARKEIHEENDKDYFFTNQRTEWPKWEIKFDLMVETEKWKSIEGWWKINVLTANLWWFLKGNSRTTNSNRISFSLFWDWTMIDNKE